MSHCAGVVQNGLRCSQVKAGGHLRSEELDEEGGVYVNSSTVRIPTDLLVLSWVVVWGRERNNEIGGRFELIGLPFAPPQRKVMYSTLDRGIKPIEVRESGKGGLQSVDRGESNVEQCRFLHHSHVGLNDQAWLDMFIQESRKRAIVGCIQLMAHLALWRSVWHCVWFMF